MLKVQSVGLVDPQTAVLPQFEYWSHQDEIYRTPRQEDHLLFAFTRPLCFDPAEDSSGRVFRYDAWLAIAKPIDVAEDVVIVRSLPVAADTPVLGFTTREPATANVIQAPFAEHGPIEQIDRQVLEMLKGMVNNACATPGCVLQRGRGMEGLCPGCHKIRAAEQTRAKAWALLQKLEQVRRQKAEAERRARIKEARKESRMQLREKLATCPYCGLSMRIDRDRCDVCREQTKARRRQVSELTSYLNLDDKELVEWLNREIDSW